MKLKFLLYLSVFGLLINYTENENDSNNVDNIEKKLILPEVCENQQEAN